jgi:hypothetical protein
VQNDLSSNEECTETSWNESEGEVKVQLATGDWQQYSESDGDLARFPYIVRQKGFLLKKSVRPKSELGYFQLFFFTDDLLIENVSAMNHYAAEKI